MLFLPTLIMWEENGINIEKYRISWVKVSSINYVLYFYEFWMEKIGKILKKTGWVGAWEIQLNSYYIFYERRPHEEKITSINIARFIYHSFRPSIKISYKFILYLSISILEGNLGDVDNLSSSTTVFSLPSYHDIIYGNLLCFSPNSANDSSTFYSVKFENYFVCSTTIYHQHCLRPFFWQSVFLKQWDGRNNNRI